MADNVGYTPGSGATVAADEIGGVLYQRVKPVTGLDGTAVDVSATNPMPMAAYGELIEAVEALRMAVSSIARNMPIVDATSQVRAIATISGTVSSVSTVSTVSSVSTVSTVSNVATLGNNAAGPIAISIPNGSFHQLRSNISVT
jgi:hypothetical protein